MTMHRVEQTEFTVLDNLATSAVTGDETGLDHVECAELGTFEADKTEAAQKAGASHWHWTCEGDATFGRCEVTGMRGQCVKLILVAFYPPRAKLA